MNDLKRLGLAVTLPEPEHSHEWLKAGARHVELQDSCEPHVMDGDWRATVKRSAERLDSQIRAVGRGLKVV